MPDTVKLNPLAGSSGFPDAAAHNAEVAAKLAAQDITGKSGAGNPEDYKDASDALDAIAAQVKPAEPVKTPEELEAEKKAADEAAAKKTADDEAAKKAADEEAAKKAAEAEAAKKAEAYFKDTPGLPPNASPKSTDAFNTIKARAAQEIEAREAKLAELQKKYDELEAKTKQPPEELVAAKKELEDLRQWRTKLDVEFDPQFKVFDQRIATANEFIYAQLRESPLVTDAVITEIKKYGGPANCNLAKVFEQLKDPVLQRIVESKIADIKVTQFEKSQAIKHAQDNVQQYVQQRQQDWTKAVTAHSEQTQKHLNELLGALDWYKEQKVADKAPEAEVKAAGDHNKFLGELKSQIAEAMKDDSPQMRAILVTGLAQLFHLQRVHAGVTAELAQVKKDLAEVTAKWDKVKAASLNRSRESNAPASGTPPVKPAAPPIGQPASDALDSLMKDVMQKRAAAAQTT